MTNHNAGCDPYDQKWHQERELSTLVVSECGVTLLDLLDPSCRPSSISIDPDNTARRSWEEIAAAAAYCAIAQDSGVSMQPFVVRSMTIIA